MITTHIKLKDTELNPIGEDVFKGNVYFMNKLEFEKKIMEMSGHF